MAELPEAAVRMGLLGGGQDTGASRAPWGRRGWGWEDEGEQAHLVAALKPLPSCTHRNLSPGSPPTFLLALHEFLLY